MLRFRSIFIVLILSASVLGLSAGCAGCDDSPANDGNGDAGDVADTTDSAADDANDADGSTDADASSSSDADGSDGDAAEMCGNGVVDDGEACDDGNSVTGDGCENDCTLSVDASGQNIELIEPPSSTEEGELENDPSAKVFVETAELALPSMVPHNEHVPRDIRSFGRKSGILVDGTRLNSYLIHSDPVGQPDQEQITFQVDFAREILAVVTTTNELDRSDDVVGRSDVTYAGDSNRGLESPDAVVLSRSRKRLTLSLQGAGSVDQIRVFTAAPQTDPSLLVFSGAIYGGSGSVVPGENEGDFVFAFQPENEVTLDSDVSVDATTPGRFDAEADLPGGTLSSGTTVQSYIAHFDPVGVSLTDGWAAFTFGQGKRVVGIIVLDSTLDQTDGVFGTENLDYPTPSSTETRGLELQNDDVLFSEDERSVWVHGEAQAGADQIRILVTDR